MQKDLQAHIVGSYREIRRAIMAWNWFAAESSFHTFCEEHREAIPVWYEDEFLFTGMKLWADERYVQVMRHFALFFERAAGQALGWSEDDAELLAAVAS